MNVSRGRLWPASLSVTLWMGIGLALLTDASPANAQESVTNFVTVATVKLFWARFAFAFRHWPTATAEAPMTTSSATKMVIFFFILLTEFPSQSVIPIRLGIERA